MKRILLKLSGEALGSGDSHFEDTIIQTLTTAITEANANDVQLAIVLGGGNFWRYRDNKTSGIERTKSDKLGMLATIFNSVRMQASLEKAGTAAHVLSALPVAGLTSAFVAEQAIELLEVGDVVLCAGGTGNPFCTTDLAAALRAAELQCDELIKVTNVDGVFTKDPNKFEDAVLLKKLTYNQTIEQDLKVMDLTAFALCKENTIPIRVCNSTDIGKALSGEDVGTVVTA